MDAGQRAAPPMSPSGGLARLLEAEARLDDQVAASLREAEAIVAAAHAVVADRLAAVERELADIGRDEAAALDAASVTRRAEIDLRATARCERLDRAGAERLEPLTSLVVSAVLRDAGEGAAP